MSKEINKSVSKFSIVRAISALFNLGNDGKLDSFLSRVVKTLNKEVQAHKKNLETLKFNYDNAIDELNDNLEDAKEALESSYLNIDINKVDTNEKQTQYVDTYLSNIDNHILKVKRIENSIEKEKELYTASVKTTQDQIDSLQLRIETISKQ